MPRFAKHQCPTCQETFKRAKGLRSHQRLVNHLPSSRLVQTNGILPAPIRPSQPKVDKARANSFDQYTLLDLLGGAGKPGAVDTYNTIIDTVRELIAEHQVKRPTDPGLEQLPGALYLDNDPDDLILDFLDSLLNDETDISTESETGNIEIHGTGGDSENEDEEHSGFDDADYGDVSFASWAGGVDGQDVSANNSQNSNNSTVSNDSDESGDVESSMAPGDMTGISLNNSILDELNESMRQLDISASMESNSNSSNESPAGNENIFFSQDVNSGTYFRLVLYGLSSRNVRIGTRASKEWGVPIGRCIPTLKRIHDAKLRKNESPAAPFADFLEFEFVKWLVEHDISQKAREKLLKAVLTRQRTKLSFTSNYLLNKRLQKLPPAGPKWQSQKLTLTGDLSGPNGEPQTEEVEMWMRNPVELVQELLENSTYGDKLVFSASAQFLDPDQKNRIFNEMWTGDWWIRMQEEWLPDGATLIPVILSSDATQLTDFVGGKKAWPVYLTIGNIPKDIRRKPSSYAMLLLGYLPVANFDCFSPKEASLEKGRLFHRCLREMLKPLVEAGKHGVKMACGDGFIRQCYPILAAYIADNPEQTMIACCRQNLCHKGLVAHDKRGDYIDCLPRHHQHTAEALEADTYHHRSQLFVDQGLKPYGIPFWADLPHCNIFTCLTPDILHQLHKGVFKDHLMSWCVSLVEDKAKIDNRCKYLPTHSTLRHFTNGITKLKQTNAKEHREMEKIFTGVMAGLVDNEVLTAVNAAIDFIYYAQLPSHTTATLQWLDSSLARFHKHKDAFISAEARSHFNINKIHSMLHYSTAVQELGSVDAYNTESPERFHIEYAKRAYQATNHIDFFFQMTEYLERRERVQKFDCYLRWAIPEYRAHIEAQENKEAARIEKLGTKDWHIALKSPFKPISSDQLPKYFDIHFFDYALDQFLKVYWTDMERRGTRPVWSPLSDHLTVYPKATQVISDQFQTGLIDILHASPQISLLHSSTRTPKRRHAAARFDTVLLTKDCVPPERMAYGMDELDVGQVRLIFTLPPRFNVPEPLVFIHSFRGPRSAEPIRHTGMFRVKRLCYGQHDGGHPLGEIYTLDSVRRTCHLIPVFDHDSPVPGPSPPPVFEDYDDFYLNSYLDLHSFQLIF